jgi:hypothetical protein
MKGLRIMKPAPKYTLQGFGIDLELYEDRLVLRKQGPIADMFGDEPDREIPLCFVTDAHLADGFTLWNGYFQCDVSREAGLPVMVTYHRENEEMALEMQQLIRQMIGKRDVTPMYKLNSRN